MIKFCFCYLKNKNVQNNFSYDVQLRASSVKFTYLKSGVIAKHHFFYEVKKELYGKFGFCYLKQKFRGLYQFSYDMRSNIYLDDGLNCLVPATPKIEYENNIEFVRSSGMVYKYMGYEYVRAVYELHRLLMSEYVCNDRSALTYTRKLLDPDTKFGVNSFVYRDFVNSKVVWLYEYYLPDIVRYILNNSPILFENLGSKFIDGIFFSEIEAVCCELHQHLAYRINHSPDRFVFSEFEGVLNGQVTNVVKSNDLIIGHGDRSPNVLFNALYKLEVGNHDLSAYYNRILELNKDDVINLFFNILDKFKDNIALNSNFLTTSKSPNLNKDNIAVGALLELNLWHRFLMYELCFEFNLRKANNITCLGWIVDLGSRNIGRDLRNDSFESVFYRGSKNFLNDSDIKLFSSYFREIVQLYFFVGIIRDIKFIYGSFFSILHRNMATNEVLNEFFHGLLKSNLKSIWFDNESLRFESDFRDLRLIEDNGFFDYKVRKNIDIFMCRLLLKNALIELSNISGCSMFEKLVVAEMLAHHDVTLINNTKKDIFVYLQGELKKDSSKDLYAEKHVHFDRIIHKYGYANLYDLCLEYLLNSELVSDFGLVFEKQEHIKNTVALSDKTLDIDFVKNMGKHIDYDFSNAKNGRLSEFLNYFLVRGDNQRISKMDFSLIDSDSGGGLHKPCFFGFDNKLSKGFYLLNVLSMLEWFFTKEINTADKIPMLNGVLGKDIFNRSNIDLFDKRVFKSLFNERYMKIDRAILRDFFIEHFGNLADINSVKVISDFESIVIRSKIKDFFVSKDFVTRNNAKELDIAEYNMFQKELEVLKQNGEKWTKLFKRFWFINSLRDTDLKILPKDYRYELKPVQFDMPDMMSDNCNSVYPNQFNQIVDRHPINFGEDLGLAEIELSVDVMVEMVNVFIMLWFKFLPAFWGWTGTQAVIGITEAVFNWLMLENSLNENMMLEHYFRAFRWIRWEAEKFSLLAKDDAKLNGNFYVGLMLEELIKYMEDHHFDCMPIFECAEKMDAWRNIFSPCSGDVTWIIDKVKGIRHKIIVGKEKNENA